MTFFLSSKVADCRAESGRAKNDMPFMTALALKFVDYDIHDMAWFPGHRGKVTPPMVSIKKRWKSVHDMRYKLLLGHVNYWD